MAGSKEQTRQPKPKVDPFIRLMCRTNDDDYATYAVVKLTAQDVIQHLNQIGLVSVCFSDNDHFYKASSFNYDVQYYTYSSIDAAGSAASCYADFSRLLDGSDGEWFEVPSQFILPDIQCDMASTMIGIGKHSIGWMAYPEHDADRPLEVETSSLSLEVLRKLLDRLLQMNASVEQSKGREPRSIILDD